VREGGATGQAECATMPAFLARYVSDQQLRESFHHWCGSPLVYAPIDVLMLAAVGIESTSPHYLDLPDVIASVFQDVRQRIFL
jgi:hypothetical protein